MARGVGALGVQLSLLCAWIPLFEAFATGPIQLASQHRSFACSLRCSAGREPEPSPARPFGSDGALDRREGLSILAGAALASVAGPEAADALCGGKPAAWEFWVPWSDDVVEFKATEPLGADKARGIYYRVVGNKGKEKTKINGKTYTRRPLLIVSDKFQSHDYLQTLEAVVTSDRRVVEYDALGAGLSEPLTDDVLKSLKGGDSAALAYASEELKALSIPLQKTLKVEGFHVFGHSFGAEVACELAKTAPPGMVASLTLAAPPKSLPPPDPKFRTLYVQDPGNLCTPDSSDTDREVFVKTVIEFMDDVDGCPTTESLFT
mmetsp:Transcript_50241/g.122628  ORF Transcript_50241/g.122628 Transcript_50241/m.122628 type:complete len:320 (+) Transcript_50241:40-999(+)